jgi:hypothetical protein
MNRIGKAPFKGWSNGDTSDRQVSKKNSSPVRAVDFLQSRSTS